MQDEVHTLLIDAFSHYCLCSLCVLGRESLDELQTLVERSFCDVKTSGDEEAPSFSDAPEAFTRM